MIYLRYRSLTHSQAPYSNWEAVPSITLHHVVMFVTTQAGRHGFGRLLQAELHRDCSNVSNSDRAARTQSELLISVSHSDGQRECQMTFDWLADHFQRATPPINALPLLTAQA